MSTTIAIPPEQDITTLITRRPGVCGGRTILAGTRIRVTVVVAYHLEGDRPEQIVEHLPTLNLARVYAALAYYYANKQRVDHEIEEDDLFARLLMERFPNGLGPEHNEELGKFLDEWDSRAQK